MTFYRDSPHLHINWNRRYNQRNDAHYNPSDDRLHNQSYDRQYNQSSENPAIRVRISVEPLGTEIVDAEIVFAYFSNGTNNNFLLYGLISLTFTLDCINKQLCDCN